MSKSTVESIATIPRISKYRIIDDDDVKQAQEKRKQRRSSTGRRISSFSNRERLSSIAIDQDMPRLSMMTEEQKNKALKIRYKAPKGKQPRASQRESRMLSITMDDMKSRIEILKSFTSRAAIIASFEDKNKKFDPTLHIDDVLRQSSDMKLVEIDSKRSLLGQQSEVLITKTELGPETKVGRTSDDKRAFSIPDTIDESEPEEPENVLTEPSAKSMETTRRRSSVDKILSQPKDPEFGEKKVHDKRSSLPKKKTTEPEEARKKDRPQLVFNIYNRPRPAIIEEVLQQEPQDESVWEIDEHVTEKASEKTLKSIASTIILEEIVPEPDFITLLRGIPEIEELSGYNIRLSDELFHSPSRDSTIIEELDGEEEQEIEFESEIEEERKEDENADMLFLLRDEKYEGPDLQKEESGFEDFKTFVDEAKRKVKIDVQITDEDMEARKKLVKETHHFLGELISDVVASCEYVDPKKILRENLEKLKLVSQLIVLIYELNEEQTACTFLNRKVVEHYRRKKAFRSIVDDDPDVLAHEMQKYKRAIDNLDLLLGKEMDLKEMREVKVSAGVQELAVVEEETEETIKELEEFIKTTVIRADHFKVKETDFPEKNTKGGKNVVKDEKAQKAQRYVQLIEKHITRMAKLRDEVSDVRFKLILRQNTLATLREHLDRLEDLGNGLHVREYENLQTEVVAIDSKINERDVELNKYRSRCSTAVAIVAHMREKRAMIRNSIIVQGTALSTMLEEKVGLRNHLYKLKSKRKNIRNELNELSFQGGLLDKPALMRDYDQTVEKIAQRREKVYELKHRNQELLDKIKIAERKCGIRSNIV